MARTMTAMTRVRPAFVHRAVLSGFPPVRAAPSPAGRARPRLRLGGRGRAPWRSLVSCVYTQDPRPTGDALDGEHAPTRERAPPHGAQDALRCDLGEASAVARRRRGASAGGRCSARIARMRSRARSTGSSRRRPLTGGDVRRLRAAHARRAPPATAERAQVEAGGQPPRPGDRLGGERHLDVREDAPAGDHADAGEHVDPRREREQRRRGVVERRLPRGLLGARRVDAALRRQPVEAADVGDGGAHDGVLRGAAGEVAGLEVHDARDEADEHRSAGDGGLDHGHGARAPRRRATTSEPAIVIGVVEPPIGMVTKPIGMPAAANSRPASSVPRRCRAASPCRAGPRSAARRAGAPRRRRRAPAPSRRRPCAISGSTTVTVCTCLPVLARAR